MKTRKLISLITLTALLLSACGKAPDTSSQVQTSEDTNIQASTNTGMGRYIESEITMPEGLEMYGRLNQMADGSIKIVDSMTGNILSSDTSVTNITSEKPAFIDSLGDISYITASTFSSSGDCVMEYSLKEDENATSFQPRYAYIQADGTVTPFSPDLGNFFISGFAFTQNNQVIGYDFSGRVYEIDYTTGSCKNLFSGSNAFSGFCVTSKYIVALDTDNIYFYDLNTGEMSQNPPALVSFLEQCGTSREVYSTESSNFNFCEGKDGALYILTSAGLYRYVLDGNSVEQLIDGKLCNISNPSYYINSFLQEESGSFLILFGGGKLIRYTYDASVSSVPETVLTIYSLKDNASVRQIISQYQSQYPEMYVNYETGLSGTDGITYDDALKNLNTEILAGNGPDIIVLDNLPVENYINKGILTDLSPYMETIDPDSSLLRNITDCYQKDGKSYGLSTKFRLPAFAAKGENLTKIHDLSSLITTAKGLTNSSKDGHIFSMHSAREALQMAVIYSGNMLSSSSAIDKNTVSTLLQSAKEMYNIDFSNVSAADLEESKQNTASFYQEMNIDPDTIESAWAFSGSVGLDILTGDALLCPGIISGFDFDFNTTASLSRVDSTVGYRFGLDDNSTVYIPSCILGLSSSGNNTETAVQFIQTAVSSSVQDVEMQDGFSVNQDSLQNFYAHGKTSDTEDGGSLGISSSDDSSEPFYFEIHWPDEEQMKSFDDKIKTLDTPLLLDKTVTDIIITTGTRYVEGSLTLEEASSEIMDKIKLRLAE